MNPIIKMILTVGVLICGTLGVAYYAFMQIDFIGQKDPKIVEENLKRWDNTLLSAEFSNGTDYCKVDLLDSVNIEINVGDNSSFIILNEEYYMLNDTIVVTGGIEHAKQYLNTNKFLIKDDKLLFKLDPYGSYDTTTTMTIKFNTIEL